VKVNNQEGKENKGVGKAEAEQESGESYKRTKKWRKLQENKEAEKATREQRSRGNAIKDT